MAKEQYRLQTLLGLRERRREEAERALGLANQALATEQKRLADMEKELERMIAKREAKSREYAEKAMRGEMAAGGAVSANAYIERLKEQERMQQDSIAGQKDVVAQREQLVEAARQELVVANQEVKALEKHKEKWQEERKRELAAKQEEALDEIGQTIFLGRDKS